MKKIFKKITIVFLLFISLFLTGCKDTSPIENKSDDVVYTLIGKDLIRMDRGNEIIVHENEVFIYMTYGYSYHILEADDLDKMDRKEKVVYIYHYIKLDKFEKNSIEEKIKINDEITVTVKGTYDFQITTINNFFYNYVEYAKNIKGLTADEIRAREYINKIISDEVYNQIRVEGTNDYQKIINNVINELDKKAFKNGITFTNINIEIN